VTKPPKPGFVGFGSTCLGDFQEFLGGFIEGVIFLRSALVVVAVLKGGGGPTGSLSYFSQGGGDVCNHLESGHQEGGIGVLGKSAFTTGCVKTPCENFRSCVQALPFIFSA